MAEKRSLSHTRGDVVFLPARESCTVMSMQEGSRVIHSQSPRESLEDAAAPELTCSSMKAEPKFPESTVKYYCNTCTHLV